MSSFLAYKAAFAFANLQIFLQLMAIEVGLEMKNKTQNHAKMLVKCCAIKDTKIASCIHVDEIESEC